MKMISFEGSVRVDLLGGTIDLPPINLILENVVTLNLATELRAKVILSQNEFEGIIFKSHDYGEELSFHKDLFNEDSFRQGKFKQYQFLARICHYFSVTSHLKIELQSGSPPGAGLGGSSAMGITLYQALSQYLGKNVFSKEERELARITVQGIESIILDAGPTGYQDYYPALYGGILALHAKAQGVLVEQLFSPQLANFLEQHLCLVYSGETRNSGINNWEVYKAFFNKNEEVRKGLEEISKLSNLSYQSIKNNSFDRLLAFIAQEGKVREKLFPKIMTPSMMQLFEEAKTLGAQGIKICGAGGGGCFLLILKDPSHKKEIEKLVIAKGMKNLSFKINPPLPFNSL